MIRKPAHLLTVDQNAKTVKGQKLGYLTGILYLAAADISGRNVCSMAELAGCKAPCLVTSGMAGVFPSIMRARINKTNYFFEAREEFMRHISIDIARLIRDAAKLELTPLVRLNGTSDIKWENIPLSIDSRTSKRIGKPEGEYANIFAVFPEVQFYDYTKIANRRDIPANYDLTFSYSGLPSFQKYVAQARDAGMRIAVVFRTAESIPASFLGLECIGGDDSDVRHTEPQGVIVALYAKGKAKTDMSGFVVDMPRRVIPLQVSQ